MNRQRQGGQNQGTHQKQLATPATMKLYLEKRRLYRKITGMIQQIRRIQITVPSYEDWKEENKSVLENELGDRILSGYMALVLGYIKEYSVINVNLHPNHLNYLCHLIEALERYIAISTEQQKAREGGASKDKPTEKPSYDPSVDLGDFPEDDGMMEQFALMRQAQVSRPAPPVASPASSFLQHQQNAGVQVNIPTPAPPVAQVVTQAPQAPQALQQIPPQPTPQAVPQQIPPQPTPQAPQAPQAIQPTVQTPMALNNPFLQHNQEMGIVQQQIMQETMQAAPPTSAPIPSGDPRDNPQGLGLTNAPVAPTNAPVAEQEVTDNYMTPQTKVPSNDPRDGGNASLLASAKKGRNAQNRPKPSRKKPQLKTSHGKRRNIDDVDPDNNVTNPRPQTRVLSADPRDKIENSHRGIDVETLTQPLQDTRGIREEGVRDTKTSSRPPAKISERRPPGMPKRPNGMGKVPKTQPKGVTMTLATAADELFGGDVPLTIQKRGPTLEEVIGD